MFNITEIYKDYFSLFFSEDELTQNFSYLHSLPSETVECQIKFKDDMMIAGLPFFFEVFNYISHEKIKYNSFLDLESKKIQKKDNVELSFNLPFNIALTGERIALNLLQKASSIATYTQKYVAKSKHIKILDTRKTTPGLRFIEKYAVNVGGGFNHRFSQMDAWMVKDNHKEFFGGVQNAIEYFQNLKGHYKPIIVEIHNLCELEKAIDLGVQYVLLDNFSSQDLDKAIALKEKNMNYEVSGGVNLENLDDYIRDGVDAISSGQLTYNAPHVDISLKFKRQ